MDNGILKSFYDSNYKSLFRYFYYKGLSIEESEDLLSETFYKLIVRYRDIILLDQVKAKKIVWGIAHNLLVDKIQANLRQRGVSIDELADIESPETLSDEEIYELEDPQFEEKILLLKESLLVAISKLSPRMNEIVTLKFYKGFTRKMISEKLSISEDMVHTYQKRAIRYLKKSLT
jgi:RNA polymerase sigma factor (sigma-70 family)